jgi:chromosome segregation ATPase
MKSKFGVTFLGVVIVGLAIALPLAKKQAGDEHAQSTASLLELSNQLNTASLDLNTLGQSNLVMTNDLAVTGGALEVTSNQLVESSGRLAQVKSELDDDQSHLSSLNGLATSLEPQNQALGKRAGSLSNNFISLTAQSVVLQQQLTTAQSNYDFLSVQLQKQTEQKAEWLRKFNDSDELRAQYNYLRFAGFY